MGLKAPFPYFGGKSKVALLIWGALGTVDHYIEPFFGSGAVLLARPGYKQGMIETVNDSDGFICNVWRSLQFSPDETARWCDWPVNHADLTARKSELLKNEDMLLENLIADPEWHDAKLAGYWIWAASCWIGSGLTREGQIPHIVHGGKGVHALGQRPHISDGGVGVHTRYNTNLYDWFRMLSERLRYVRVVCGDWTRVCGGNWQTKLGVCGMYFDPPYGVTDRHAKIYHHDSTDVAKDVLAWVKERGVSPEYRIVLSGYEEYEELLSCDWRGQNWKANGGYGNSGDGQGKKNSHREMLYFSPHCLIGQPNLGI